MHSARPGKTFPWVSRVKRQRPVKARFGRQDKASRISSTVLLSTRMMKQVLAGVELAPVAGKHDLSPLSSVLFLLLCFLFFVDFLFRPFPSFTPLLLVPHGLLITTHRTRPGTDGELGSRKLVRQPSRRPPDSPLRRMDPWRWRAPGEKRQSRVHVWRTTTASTIPAPSRPLRGSNGHRSVSE